MDAHTKREWRICRDCGSSWALRLSYAHRAYRGRSALV